MRALRTFVPIASALLLAGCPSEKPKQAASTSKPVTRLPALLAQTKEINQWHLNLAIFRLLLMWRRHRLMPKSRRPALRAR